jgi:hypothetical protein
VKYKYLSRNINPLDYFVTEYSKREAGRLHAENMKYKTAKEKEKSKLEKEISRLEREVSKHKGFLWGKMQTADFTQLQEELQQKTDSLRGVITDLQLGLPKLRDQ